MKNTLRCATLLVALMINATAAKAADAFTDAVQAAYPPYRMALFKTNSKSQEDSRAAVRQARDGWSQLMARFASQAPAPYDRDAQLAATLKEVDQAYAKAAAEIEENKLAQAHDTLEQVRDLLSDLRRRNNVIVFSDHMNAYHSEMEVMISEGAKRLVEPQGMMVLMARAGVLDYLAKRLTSEAAPAQQANAEFSELAAAVAKSVGTLREALLAGNAERVKQAIDGLKKPYSRLFARFG